MLCAAEFMLRRDMCEWATIYLERAFSVTVRGTVSPTRPQMLRSSNGISVQ